MGEVISRQRLEEDKYPRADGLSQLMVAKAILRVIRNYNEAGNLSNRRLAPPELTALNELFGSSRNEEPNPRNFGISFQGYGSTFTGQAGRRGDFDAAVGWARLDNGLYVRSRTEEEVIEQDLFVRSLKKMVKEIAASFHVHAEVRFVSMVDTHEGTSDLLADDPLFLDHIAQAPQEWRIGDPLQNLRKRAIDIDKPLSPAQEEQIIATAFGYMTLKAEGFAGAQQWLEEVLDGTFDFKMWQEEYKAVTERDINDIPTSIDELQCETLQRTLEFAKAVVRKMIAVGVVEGRHAAGADVTSRADMYQRFQTMARIIDKSGELDRNHKRLVRLDVQYDELLEYTIAEKKFGEYEKWIQKQLVVAVELAYQLAARCYHYIEKVIDDKEIVMANFPGFYEDAYRLATPDDVGMGGPITSSSAPLSSVHLR